MALEKLLKGLLTPLHRQKSPIPWSQLRKMNPKERLSIKESRQEKCSNSPLNKSIVCGINAVTRGLENKDFCSVLLDSNVESIIIKHIVTMSEHENIPVVLIPFLKTITSDTIGFRSAALALKSDVKHSMDHHFHALHEKVLELSNSFVRPKLLTQTFSRELFRNAETAEKNSAKSADCQNVKKCTETFTLSSNVYLYRSSPKERVFIPEEANADLHLSPSPKEKDGFIPFEEDISSTFKNDVNSNENIRKKDPSSKRYVDFNDKIDNGKVFIKNESEEIFVFLDTSSAAEIQNGNNESVATGKLCKKTKKIQRCATTNFKYAPLKIKRMQGNCNRVKATKARKNKNS